MPGPKYPNAQTEAEWFRTVLRGLVGHDLDLSSTGGAAWWIGAACDCIVRGNAQLITSRDQTVVYMLRCWLSPPQPTTAGQHAKYESGNAVLLHWILQPDDIPYLHNHPWEFTTRILAGGYTEERTTSRLQADFSPGMTSRAGLGTFHRIMAHLAGNGDPTTGQGGTWTLVTTGPRVQPWSFLIDGCERDAETFLRKKQDQEAAGTQLHIDTDTTTILDGRKYQ